MRTSASKVPSQVARQYQIGRAGFHFSGFAAKGRTGPQPAETRTCGMTSGRKPWNRRPAPPQRASTHARSGQRSGPCATPPAAFAILPPSAGRPHQSAIYACHGPESRMDIGLQAGMPWQCLSTRLPAGPGLQGPSRAASGGTVPERAIRCGLQASALTAGAAAAAGWVAIHHLTSPFAASREPRTQDPAATAEVVHTRNTILRQTAICSESRSPKP